MEILNDKLNNVYLISIKLNVNKKSINAVVSEVLKKDFINIFSIAKQEEIILKDMLVDAKKYLSENLNPILFYEAKLDENENKDDLKKKINSINIWEREFENKIKLFEYSLGSASSNLYTYSIINESNFQGENLSSFLFSDESKFNWIGNRNDNGVDTKISILNDDNFQYFSKIIYTEELKPHLILNTGTYYNVWVNKVIEEDVKYYRTINGTFNVNNKKEEKEKKKLSDVINEQYDFKWEVSDENDLEFFINKIKEVNLLDKLNQNSYDKWLDYKNHIGLEESKFKYFFDIMDFYYFFYLEGEDFQKVIESPNHCTKKRQCKFCHSMTHADFDVCYFCSYNETLNLFNKLNDNINNSIINLYYTYLLKYKEIIKLKKELNFLTRERDAEYKESKKWYKLNIVNVDKFNNTSEYQKRIDKILPEIDHIENILEKLKINLKQKESLDYLNMNLSEVMI
jgi:hypothetical protein